MIRLWALEGINVESLKTKAVSDTAFKLLKLDQAGDDIFVSTQFQTCNLRRQDAPDNSNAVDIDSSIQR
ncbi:hypothetical protein GQ600_17108 [Phytophthora cactorum]|nr:hypothetical protein GQ600_17108 [Phytophthora cactorum]